ncbi:PQQ-binding-like beta-propeller repeat protein [Nocardiopsis sp. CC223A]|uniref:outer membrane protein assembly factor BamB family protein n=1 Tax=Nocardiopsis sp. CC223A TaxID=3044051 RepID=UPI002795B25E|nr:PQQ-binding-like beta-propeller repeat protein [Nocardiopsis sp. CC223A]
MPDATPLSPQLELTGRDRVATALRAALAILLVIALPWSLAGLLSITSTTATVAVAAVLTAVAACAAVPRMRPRLLRLILVGPVSVFGDLLLFGGAVAAAWFAWPTWVAVLIGLLALITWGVRRERWREWTSGRSRLPRAVLACAVLLALFLVSPARWAPVADLAVCGRLSVDPGRSGAWPDGEPVEHDPTDPEPHILDPKRLFTDRDKLEYLATVFEGNDALGRARWSVPVPSSDALGDTSRTILVGDDGGFGVYDARDGQVLWNAHPDQDTRSSAGWDEVHLIGGVVLVERTLSRASEGYSRAVMALDIGTGRRLWCAPGLTGVVTDPHTPDRVLAREGDSDPTWTVLDPTTGNRVAHLDSGPVKETSPADGAAGGAVMPQGIAAGGGHVAVWNGPALAVYDLTDGRLLFTRELTAPAIDPEDPLGDEAEEENTWPGVTDVVMGNGEGPAVIVNTTNHLLRNHRFFTLGENSLTAFDPHGGVRWRSDPGSDGRPGSVVGSVQALKPRWADEHDSSVVETCGGSFTMSTTTVGMDDGRIVSVSEPEARLPYSQNGSHLFRSDDLSALSCADGSVTAAPVPEVSFGVHALSGGTVVAVDRYPSRRGLTVVFDLPRP